jgi:copper chaperone CopZ
MKKMKWMLLSLVGLAFALCSATKASAQQQKEVLTDTIKTPTVSCDQCKKIVEDYMSHEDGILKCTADWRKKITVVKYMTSRTNIENIKTAIANVGFDAGDVTANPDSYKSLPLYCKKPEDGGGPQKKQ